jgi:hypothetical protein
MALFSGGAIAGGFAALERRRYQQARERVALAPERFLDLLVQRRRRLPARVEEATERTAVTEVSELNQINEVNEDPDPNPVGG